MNGDNEQYFSEPPHSCARPPKPLPCLTIACAVCCGTMPAASPPTTLAAEFGTLLDDPEDPFRRERLAGHFTASCWLVSADGQRLLLTHHRKLQRWLQLGGHADGDRDLAQVARRRSPA